MTHNFSTKSEELEDGHTFGEKSSDVKVNIFIVFPFRVSVSSLTLIRVQAGSEQGARFLSIEAEIKTYTGDEMIDNRNDNIHVY